LEIPASIHRSGIPTATHSIGDEETGRKKRTKNRKSPVFYIYISSHEARGDDSLPATRASSAAVG